MTFTALYSLTGCDGTKKTPIAEPPQPASAPGAQSAPAQPPHTNALKAPIDKTRDTLLKIKAQNAEGGI